jgi:hypothetical protein
MLRKERIPEFEIPRPELKVETQKNSTGLANSKLYLKERVVI